MEILRESGNAENKRFFVVTESIHKLSGKSITVTEQHVGPSGTIGGMPENAQSIGSTTK
jgi:hypothetical protein